MEEQINISALQHYMFCKRQCALIHIEKVWLDNRYTIEGTAYHDRVDDFGTHTLRGKLTKRAEPLWEDNLNLIGKADTLVFEEGFWMPIEYKRGKLHHVEATSVQLCAQALCIEYMTGKKCPKGAIYWISSRKRTYIEIDDDLRILTTKVISQVSEMIQKSKLPISTYTSSCSKCSLQDICLPKYEVNDNV